MTITFNASAAVPQATALRQSFDNAGAAGAGGYARLYSGTRPASGGAATGSLVVTCPLAWPCGTVDSAGTLNLAAGQDGIVTAGATPTWARVFDAAGTRVLDCGVRLNSAAATAGDPEEIVVFAPSGILAGAYIKITGGSFAVPT